MLLETVVESPGSSSTGCFFGHGAESWRETSFLVSWFKYVSHADDIPLCYACLRWPCWHCCHQGWPELPSACFALRKYWLLIPTQHLGSTYSIGQYWACDRHGESWQNVGLRSLFTCATWARAVITGPICWSYASHVAVVTCWRVPVKSDGGSVYENAGCLMNLRWLLVFFTGRL